MSCTVATALTVYGIETIYPPSTPTGKDTVATALTVYGIETYRSAITDIGFYCRCNSTYCLRY